MLDLARLVFVVETDVNTKMLTLSFFFNDTATTEIYPLSLHDALPICEDAAVALHRCSEREPPPGVPRRRLHDQAARLEPALPLRRLDHRETDPVLHRAARVEELGLRVHRGPDPLRHLVEANEGRPPDRLENVRVRPSVGRHRSPGWLGWSPPAPVLCPEARGPCPAGCGAGAGAGRAGPSRGAPYQVLPESRRRSPRDDGTRSAAGTLRRPAARAVVPGRSAASSRRPAPPSRVPDSRSTRPRGSTQGRAARANRRTAAAPRRPRPSGRTAAADTGSASRRSTPRAAPDRAARLLPGRRRPSGPAPPPPPPPPPPPTAAPPAPPPHPPPC